MIKVERIDLVPQYVKLLTFVQFILLIFFNISFISSGFASNFISKYCYKSTKASLCVEEKPVGLNIERHYTLEIQKDDIVNFITRSGRKADTLLACSELSINVHAQSDGVFGKISEQQRTQMRGARMLEFDLNKEGNLLCRYLSLELHGMPGSYAILSVAEGRIGSCLTEIVRRINEHGYRIMRQTSEAVLVAPRSRPHSAADQLSLSCGTNPFSVTVRNSAETCVLTSEFYNEILDLSDIKNDKRLSFTQQISQAASIARKSKAGTHTAKFDGFLVYSNFVPADRTSQCLQSLVVYTDG